MTVVGLLDDDDACWTRGEAGGGSRLLGDIGACKQRELTSFTATACREGQFTNQSHWSEQAHQDLHFDQVYHLHLQFRGLRPVGRVDWAVVVVPTSFFPTTSREPASPSPSAHCLMSSLASLHDVNPSSHIHSLFVAIHAQQSLTPFHPSKQKHPTRLAPASIRYHLQIR